jgi:hypothetical protein
MSKQLAVPDIINKGQRVLRTIVQVGIPSFLVFALILPNVITALGLPVDSQVYVTLIAFAGGVTAIAGAITRVMAIPAVDVWLTSIGLGSVKKSEAQTTPAVGTPADPNQPAAGVPPADV